MRNAQTHSIGIDDVLLLLAQIALHGRVLAAHLVLLLDALCWRCGSAVAARERLVRICLGLVVAIEPTAAVRYSRLFPLVRRSIQTQAFQTRETRIWPAVGGLCQLARRRRGACTRLVCRAGARRVELSKHGRVERDHVGLDL